MTNKNESNSDIHIDFTDYKEILNYRGRISGYHYDVMKLDELEKEINDTVIDDLKNAKGILIEFKINQKESLFALNNILISIQESVNNDVEVIFGTKIYSIINLGEISCKILLTGLD